MIFFFGNGNILSNALKLIAFILNIQVPFWQNANKLSV